MKFILTGGTIDSYYNPDLCTPVPYKESVIAGYLKKTVEMDISGIEFEQICMKDSRQIDENDRKAMLKAIEESKQTEFVITHGTFTLFETARYLEANLSRKDVKVTLTGALIPLLGFSPTDAGFNVAGAMINSQTNQAGVYVYIKGVICKPNEELQLHT